MTERDELATKWNVRHRYAKEQSATAPVAARVLTDFQRFLPGSGDALDLAAGRGGNARFMHRAGLNTCAWDLSEVAMKELKASEPGIHIEVRDVIDNPPTANRFDVIAVSRFLHRDLCAAIEASLKINGVLFYQTFTKGLSNPDFMLGPNELLTLFPSLHVLSYTEAADEDEAMLVATRLT